MTAVGQSHFTSRTELEPPCESGTISGLNGSGLHRQSPTNLTSSRPGSSAAATPHMPPLPRRGRMGLSGGAGFRRLLLSAFWSGHDVPPLIARKATVRHRARRPPPRLIDLPQGITDSRHLSKGLKAIPPLPLP